MTDEKQERRLSIYASDELLRVLAERRDTEYVGMSGSGRSGLIAAIADRYAEVCRRELPDLTAAEWGLIYDAQNGTINDPAGALTVMLRANVADSIALNRYDAKWGVDGRALVTRLAALGYAQILAVADAAERFWSDTTATDDQLRERQIPVPRRNAELADRMDAEFAGPAT